MTAMRVFELLLVFLTSVGVLFGAYQYLDTMHAKERDLLKARIEIQSEMLDRDIKKNAEARVFYKDLSKDRALEKAEQSRLEYLEEQLEQKYDEQRILREAEMRLEVE